MEKSDKSAANVAAEPWVTDQPARVKPDLVS
jgi:hypothetical protein